MFGSSKAEVSKQQLAIPARLRESPNVGSFFAGSRKKSFFHADITVV